MCLRAGLSAETAGEQWEAQSAMGVRFSVSHVRDSEHVSQCSIVFGKNMHDDGGGGVHCGLNLFGFLSKGLREQSFSLATRILDSQLFGSAGALIWIMVGSVTVRRLTLSYWIGRLVSKDEVDWRSVYGFDHLSIGY